MKMCSKCGNKIDSNVVECPYCVRDNTIRNDIGNQQIDENIVNVADKVVTGIRLVKLLPVIFVGAIFMIVGVLFLVVGEYNSKKYKGEVVASFVELTNCDEYDSESGYCDAKYLYNIDGIDYEVYDSFVTEDYDLSLVVHYNLDNPSEYTLSDTGSSMSNIYMIVFGVILVIMGVVGIKNKNIKVK